MDIIPFPQAIRNVIYMYHHNQMLVLLLLFCCFCCYLLWRTNWKTKYKRMMRTIFHHCGLYVRSDQNHRQTRLYPTFIAFDESDEEYTMMRYHLRPGQSLGQFEDKTKFIEAAFNRKVIIYGKGKYIIFKIRKTPFDEPGI